MLETQDLCESFLEHLIAEDVIDAEAAVHVLDEQRQQTPRIGRIALQRGLLTMKQVFAVLRVQADTGLRFGMQAIELGYLTPEQLEELLDEQQRSRPGIGGLVHDLGYARKGVLQKKRREFLKRVEVFLA